MAKAMAMDIDPIEWVIERKGQLWARWADNTKANSWWMVGTIRIKHLRPGSQYEEEFAKRMAACFTACIPFRSVAGLGDLLAACRKLNDTGVCESSEGVADAIRAIREAVAVCESDKPFPPPNGHGMPRTLSNPDPGDPILRSGGVKEG